MTRSLALPWLVLPVALFAVLGCARLPTRVVLQPLFLAAPVTTSQTFTYMAGSRIDEVLPGDRVRIPRGKLHGLVAGTKNLTVHPMRPIAGTTTRALRTDTRLARADIVELQPSSAILQLHHQADPVEVGDYVEYAMQVPEALRGDAVFEASAMDVALRAMNTNQLLYGLEELLQQPTRANRDAILARMTVEVTKHADLAKDVWTKRIEGGIFHGKQLHQAMAATTPEHMAKFMGYLRAFPATYIGNTLVLVDAYGNWVINRTYDDRDFVLGRHIQPLLNQAQLALEKGDLALAEESWIAALKEKPHDTDIPEKLKILHKIRHLQARVAADTDDTEARWALLTALWDNSIYDLVLEQVTALERLKANPDTARKYRGMVAMRREEWPACVSHLSAVDGKPGAGNLSLLVKYCTERQNIAESKADYSTYMRLGALHEEEEVWASAIARYQDALDAAEKPDQAKAAADGQRRSAASKELSKDADNIDELLREHSVKSAKSKWPRIAYGCSFQKDVKACEVKYLERFGETARSFWEYETAEYFMQQWTMTAPKQANSWRTLGWLQYETGRFASADATVKHSLQLDPKSAYGLQILARIALALGNNKDAEALSRKAIELDSDYAWPWESLARALAALNKYPEAQQAMEAARKIRPNEGEIEATRNQILIAADGAKLLNSKNNLRQTMRIARAFARMQLFAVADSWLAKLPKNSAQARDVSRAIAEQETLRVDPDRQVLAAESAGDTSPNWQATVRYLKAKRDHLRNRSGETRLLLGRAYLEQARFAQALALCQVFAEDGTPEADVVEAARRGMAAEDRYSEALAATQRADFALALKLSREARGGMRDVNTRRTIEMGWPEVNAMVFLGGSERKQAADLVQQLIVQAEQMGLPSTLRDLIQLRAWVESMSGTLGTREAAVQGSLAGCVEEDNEYCQASLQMELATLTYEAGRLLEAIVVADRALTLANRVGDTNLILRAIGQLADQNFAASKLPEAERLGRELLAQSRKALEDESERFALMVLGAVAMKRGDLQTARQHFGEVYELGRRRGNNAARALARLFEGRAVLQLGHDAKEARPLLAQAVQLYELLNNDYDVCRSLSLLGMAESELGQLDEARKHLSESAEIAKRMDRRLMLASARTELSMLELKAGNTKAALSNAQEAAALTATIDQGETRWGAHYALAKALDKAGDMEAAGKAYEAAVLGVTEQLKGATGDSDRDGQLKFGRLRDVIRDAIEFNLRNGRVDRALELLESARDAELRRAFDPTRIKAQSAGLSKALDQVKQADAEVSASKKALQEELSKPEDQQDKKRIEALGGVVAQTAGEQRKLLLRLRRDHGALIGHMSVDPQSVNDMRDTLPPDSIFVQYFQTPDRLYIFVVSKEAQKTKVVTVPVSHKQLEEAVFAWRRGVQARTPTRSAKAPIKGIGRPAAPKVKRAEALDAEAGEVDSAATMAQGKQLYQWLLQPIEAELAASKTAVLLPFGPLYYLPLHALVATGPEGKTQFAIEKFRLSYASSTTVFKMLLKQRPERKERTLLAFGNPDGTLPGARHEVEQVQAKSFPTARTFYEKDATKARFFELAGQYRIIHFATHGVLSEDALASHLKMAGEPLTVEEIGGFEGMDGKTDLVVLSACETALEVAKTSMGQELTSLATAFGYAGAPALVASLWEVDDEATAELMMEFYRLLHTQPDMDTLEALRQAQIHVMKLTRDGVQPFADPSYWAAFQLIGDYR